MLPFTVKAKSSKKLLPHSHSLPGHGLSLSSVQDHSFMSDWMRAVRTPTAYRVGSAVHLNTGRLAKIGIMLLIMLTFAVLLLPASDYNPKLMKRVLLHPQYNNTYPLSKPENTIKGTRFRIGVITDLDTESKHNEKKNIWMSYYLKGYLTISPDHTSISIEWDHRPITLQSTVSSKGRGMELSELVAFNGKLYTCDDRTGIVSEITPDHEVLPWAVLNDGDGRQVKGFKCEWATVKDETLLVGGLGKEWTTTTGIVQNFWPQWVKTIGHTGDVVHHDWISNYNKLRNQAGFQAPGYMIHESGVWSDVHKQWFFLPRRASTETYEEEADEQRASNILFRADEKFQDITFKRIGPFHPSHGFSSFKFIPGTNDEVIVALKSEEKNAVPVASYIMAFNLDGDILLDETKIGDYPYKFEGIEFI